MSLDLVALTRYLEERHGVSVRLESIRRLDGQEEGADALKQFGYGAPLLLDYCAGDRRLREVLHRIRRTPFGRERDDDRAAAVWFDYRAFNELPRHVPAVDMVMRSTAGTMRSVGDAEELLLVTAYKPGRLYADDLVRLRDDGGLTGRDVARVEALALYLAEIHAVQIDDPALWHRRLRDLVGDGEGIMGLTDSYDPGFPLTAGDFLCRWEEAANRWRWRLKPQHHRLCQVHGDFHPFNILFAQGAEFHVLDRSRGVAGEAADDVSCLTVNYLFFSLQRYGRLDHEFCTLYQRFWDVYLDARPDEEMLEVIQPWFGWRVLVLASPRWYPTIDEEVRRQLLTFGRRVMDADHFDYRNPNRYLT